MCSSCIHLDFLAQGLNTWRPIGMSYPLKFVEYEGINSYRYVTS